MEQVFPLERGTLTCRETGGSVSLTMQVRGDNRGLYKGILFGEKGRMELGTLLPEGGCLGLQRTVPVERLRRQGCWPVTGGKAVLTYAFGRGTLPGGWGQAAHPWELFSRDCVLRDSAEKLRGCLLRRTEHGFLLAVPFSPQAPFPLLPVFCFARAEQLGGGRYVCFRFQEGGVPVMPGREPPIPPCQTEQSGVQ